MIKNTFDDTIFYSSVPRTIFPAAKFYSIARKIITRKVVPGTTYSNTPLIKTPIPACCKIPVRALKPTIVQRIDTCGSIANYNYKMPLVNGWVIRKSRNLRISFEYQILHTFAFAITTTFRFGAFIIWSTMAGVWRTGIRIANTIIIVVTFYN